MYSVHIYKELVREREEVGTGEVKRHEWEVHLSNFTMNLFTI